MAPSLRGKGWGWVVLLQQPKRSAGFPTHRLKIPPPVPLTRGRGLVGGLRWDARAQADLSCIRARSDAAAVQARLAQRVQRSDRRSTKRGGWRGDRAGPSTCRYSGGPAWGVAGDVGDDLSGAHSDKAQRSREHDGQFVKRVHC